MYRTLLMVSAGLALWTASSQAQLNCLVPAGCSAGAPSRKEIILLQLDNPQPGDTVLYLRASAGVVPDSVKLKGGLARIVWTADRPASQVIIRATIDGTPLGSRTITFGTAVRIAAVQAKSAQWYESRQLKKPAIVKVLDDVFKPVMDTTLCRSTAVLFKSYGEESSAAMDTAYGIPIRTRTAQKADSIIGCQAESEWRLGKGAATHLMRATLVNDPSQRIEYKAKSRSLPYLALGLAASYNSGFVDATSTERVVTIIRRSQVSAGGDSLEVKFDSTAITSSGLSSHNPGSQLSPVAGVNFPVVLSVEWLRGFVGVDLKSPTTDWYAGLSLTQIADWQHESTGYDLALTLHMSRRNVIEDSGCAADLSKCKSNRQYWPVGGALVVTLNTGTVLDKVLASMGIK